MDTATPPKGISLDYLALQAELIYTAADLSRVASLSNASGDAQESARASDRLNHLASGAFVVGIIGQFNRGKSTLANALLGAPVMPADIEPTTATINRVVYGRRPQATLCMTDSTRKSVPIDALKDFITKLSAGAEHFAAGVEQSLIEFPARLCMNNVQLLDTPGLDDTDTTMSDRTRAVLPRIDAALLVTNALAPLESTELQVLADLGQHVDSSRIFIVINHADRIDEEDRDRVASAAQQRARQCLQVDKPRMFMLSAREGLRGKLDKDAPRLERSGLLALEEALETFLVRDSGMARVQAANENVAQLAQALLERSEARYTELKGADQHSAHRLSSLERNLDEVVLAIQEWPHKAQTQVADHIVEVDGRGQETQRQIHAMALVQLREVRFSEADIQRENRHNKLRGALMSSVMSRFDALMTTDQDRFRTLLLNCGRDLQVLSNRWDDALKANVANESVEGVADAAADIAQPLSVAVQDAAAAVMAESREQFRQKYVSLCDMQSLKAEAASLVTMKFLAAQRAQVVAAFPAEYAAHVPRTIDQAFLAAQRQQLHVKAIDQVMSHMLREHRVLADRCARMLQERKWLLRLEREKLDKERVRAEERTMAVRAGAQEILSRADARRQSLRQILQDVANTTQ